MTVTGIEMTNSALEAWFAAAPQGQHATLSELRRLIKSLDPEVVEELKWGRPCYSGGRGLFYYLQSTINHVSLGFQNGASLDDANGLLEGTGKEMRHMKLGQRDEFGNEALVELLRQAWRSAS